jgi:ABC-type sugar transport system substrate-binding protein
LTTPPKITTLRAMRNLHVVLLIAASCVLSACDKGGSSGGGAAGEAKSEGGKLVVGFSQIGAESSWRTAETESIRGEAQKRGIDLRFSDAQSKRENQIRALKTFAQQGVKAIILAPVISDGWSDTLSDIKKANIPVILVDRGINVDDQSLYATLIASDFVQEGQRAGDWLAKKMDGKGNIVQLEGTTGAAPAIDRASGFKKAIEAHPDMKIIMSQSGDFNRTKGKEVMEAFLKARGKEINAVYAHNDDMALGAIQAIEEAGMKPGTDIIVVSIDGIKPALEAIVAGKLNCTVECNPLLGPAAFDVVESIVKGNKPDHKIVVHDELFDSSNAAAALPNRKY